MGLKAVAIYRDNSKKVAATQFRDRQGREEADVEVKFPRNRKR